MGIFNYIEYCLGSLLRPFRGYDAKLFTKGPAFVLTPNPTITITSLDCGASGSVMKLEHAMQGEDRFPQLEWTCDLLDVREYLLISEDPDAPIPISPTHGLFWGIPATTRSLGPEDISVVQSKDTGKHEVATLRGPVKLGKNIKGGSSVYIGPGPPLGHRPHRYFYELVALNEALDPAKLSKMPDRKELGKAIEGKVVAWGQWVGTYEKQWL